MASVSSVPKPWTTSASASISGADGVVTLVEGSAFCISARSGEIDPAHPQGLFFRDTRFLSEMRLTLNGNEPEPLAATAVDPFSGVFVLRGRPAAGQADSQLLLFRRRYVGRGMRENLEIHNCGDSELSCTIEIDLRADFADVFEVKEGRAHKHGGFEHDAEGSRLVFRYTRDAFTRATYIDFGEDARIAGTHVAFKCKVPPHGIWNTCVSVTPVIGDEEITPRYRCGEPVERSTPVARLTDWKSRMPVVTADHEQFRALLERSTDDLAALRIFDPEFPDRPVVAAGAPWFMALFGRDSLLTSWMTMLVDSDLALGTLQTLARFQGTKEDDNTEEQPGRILHEMRFGETAALALGGGRIYYGSVDATPLFVMLVGELSRWGNRQEDVDALLPAADAALEWIESRYGDPDQDGYVEYHRKTDHGLQNQGWKDSWDSMRFMSGRIAEPPIALCEVQGYAYAALIARSHIATEAGDDARAAKLIARADELKRRFNEDFWIDTPDGGYIALGLDCDKKKIDGIGSNQGHCLWTGIVDEEKAPLVARSLLSDGLFGGWGIRTLSESDAGFNPISYHCGSVWPHDNAICAAGLMRYGLVDDAHRVMRGLIDASPWFGDLLPELFAGIGRYGLGFPVAYPTSCSPQAWAAASPLLFLRTLLRFEPDIRRSVLHLAPAIPDWIGTLRLERIPLMGGHLGVEVTGEVVRVLEVPEGLEIVSDPRAATR
jgi:glycogen debranching enzyme